MAPFRRKLVRRRRVASLRDKLRARGAEVLRNGCALVETWRRRVSARFGEFVFDESSRELRAGGRRVPLSPKAFDLLALLFRERPRALSKAELRDRLWPDTFVGETSLPRVVGEIRRALGDRPERASFLRTVHRFGYAFVGEAAEAGSERAGVSPESGCALLWGERRIPLPEGANVVGRDPECVLTIPSGHVSRRHAQIIVTGGKATVQDLGSKNGTLVGGKRVRGEKPLVEGDEIRIGPALLVFCTMRAGSTQTGR
jgi:DNA-binding winged helix-turn-helix (wHTH) protein